MTLWKKSMAELTTASKTARGSKQVKILQELQKRWDELTPREITEFRGGYRHIFQVPRFNFELCYR